MLQSFLYIFLAMKNQCEYYSLPRSNAACQQLILSPGGETIRTYAPRFKLAYASVLDYNQSGLTYKNKFVYLSD